MNFIRERPVVFWGLLTTLLESVIGLLLIFGVLVWTAEEVGAVMLAVAALGGVFTFVVQGQVTPMHNPKDDDGNPLTPGPIDSQESSELPGI
jgi:uncharacterized membrane protein YphA (DoxX/SURF4 family)